MKILVRGTPARKKLDGIESQIGKCKSEIDSLEGAMYPVAKALQDIRGGLQRGAPGVRSVVKRLAVFSSPNGLAHGEYWSLLSEPLTLMDLADLLGMDDLMKRIEPVLAKEIVGAGLPPDERQKKASELRAQVKALEADAEREALSLESQGHVVIRREDADIAVVFAVWAEGPAGAIKGAAEAAGKWEVPAK